MTTKTATKPVVLAAICRAITRNEVARHGDLPSAGPLEIEVLAASFCDLACTALTSANEQEWTNPTARFASHCAHQGLTMVTGRAMLEALFAQKHHLCEKAPLDETRLFQFGLFFMEQLASGREQAFFRREETARNTLQNALHNQLHEQRRLRRDLEWRTEKLQHILQHSADLAQIKNEDTLLTQALQRLTTLLALDSATIYHLDRTTGNWSRRESIIDRPASDRISRPVTLLLNEISAGADHAHRHMEGGLMSALRLNVGKYTLGALVTRMPTNDRGMELLLATFAMNLAVHWRNLQLFLDSRRRTRELEILHGRYVDEIWQSQSATLQARFFEDHLEVIRNGAGPPEPGENPQSSFDLVVGDRPLGMVQFPSPESLTREEENFIQELVQEMGSALNNARLIQATRSYSRQLRAAADVSRAISTLLDQETLMAEVVDLIGRRFGYPHVGLFLLAEQKAILRAASGPAGTDLAAQGYALSLESPSPVTKAIQMGRVVTDHAVHEGNEFTPLPAPLNRSRSQLALPLIARGNILGVLDVHSHEPGAFTAEEITVLQTLAEQVAVALDNAGLFAQVQESYLRMNHLYQAGRQINTATDFTGIFQGLVDYAATSHLVDYAFILKPDSRSPENLMLSNFWSQVEGSIPPPILPLEQNNIPMTDMLAGNETLVIHDDEIDQQIDPALQTLFHQLNAAAGALLPIRTEGRWLGSLVLARVENRPFSEELLHPFLSLCGQAGVALNNQFLLRETNALYHISQTLNQSLTIEDALLNILEQVARYTGISLCRVILFDEFAHAGREVYSFDLRTEAEIISPANEGVSFTTGADSLFAQLQTTQAPYICLTSDASCPPDAAAFLALHELDALLCIPILVQQRLLGFLALDSVHGDRPFTTTNRNFAQNAVAQLTTYLENLSLFDEANKRAQDLIRLNQVVTRLAGILDLDTLLDVLFDEVRHLLTVDIFFLVRFQPDSATYTVLRHLVDGRPHTPQPAGPLPLPLSTPLSSKLRQGSVLTGETAFQFAAAFQTYPGQRPQSMMWFALQEEKRPVGLIAVHAYRLNAYNENDQQILRSIATQAGLAITNARLFRRTQENVAEFRLLFSISQAAASRVKAEERLVSMVQALHQGLRGCTIAIYNMASGGDHLELMAYAGDLLPRPVLSFAGGLTGQVARLAQPLIVNQLNELPEYETEIEGAKAQLSAPLSVGQHLVGAIAVAAAETNAFSERDLRLVETLSVSLAATIESSRQVANIQATNERLRELDQLKNRFLANMTHELRTPLNAIIGFSRLMLKEIDGPLTIEQQEDLTTIYENGQHLLLLINDVLDLAKIEAGKIALVIHEVDLPKLVHSITATIRGLLHDKPVILQVNIAPEVPVIEGDEVRLRQVLLNLLSNSAKYTSRGEITCTIAPVDADHVQIVIRDTGMGIDPADYGRLFRAFEQADSSARAGEGTGLGLPISKSLVEMHNGRIWFESELGKGSSFHVLLPVSQPPANMAGVDLPVTGNP